MGLGSRVSGLGSRGSGPGSMVYGLGCLGSRVQGLGSGVWGLGSRSRGLGLGSRVSGLGARVSGQERLGCGSNLGLDPVDLLMQLLLLIALDPAHVRSVPHTALGSGSRGRNPGHTPHANSVPHIRSTIRWLHTTMSQYRTARSECVAQYRVAKVSTGHRVARA
eukprot:304042-Rhodomonas_salina.1